LDLKVYVVWLPIFNLDSESKLAGAISRISDARVAHYWDRDDQLARKYSFLLNLNGELAYDIYMLYGPQTEWGNEPPNPELIMHQQIDHAPRGRLLNGDSLVKEIRKRIALKVN
jgi:hypothetical protein